MDTNAPFLSYAKKHFSADLPPSDIWANLDDLVAYAPAPQDVVARLCDTYASHLQHTPALEVLARPLFFAIVLHGACQPSTAHWWIGHLAKVVPLWTRNGARDMSDQEAGALSTLLRDRLHYGENERNHIARMLWTSPALWKEMGEHTLHVCGIEAQTMQDDMSDKTLLLHRYCPERTVFDPRDEKNAYAVLCGLFQDVKPTLLDMTRILEPRHHRTLAWNIAINHCEKPGPGQWMALAPVLSSLNIHPGDMYSWELMVRLNDCKAHDPSCAQLVDALHDAHPDMAAAYKNYWPAVHTLYEDRQRCQAALELWQHASHHQDNRLELPALSLE